MSRAEARMASMTKQHDKVARAIFSFRTFSEWPWHPPWKLRVGCNLTMHTYIYFSNRRVVFGSRSWSFQGSTQLLWSCDFFPALFAAKRFCLSKLLCKLSSRELCRNTSPPQSSTQVVTCHFACQLEYQWCSCESPKDGAKARHSMLQCLHCAHYVSCPAV